MNKIWQKYILKNKEKLMIIKRDLIMKIIINQQINDNFINYINIFIYYSYHLYIIYLIDIYCMFH